MTDNVLGPNSGDQDQEINKEILDQIGGETLEKAEIVNVGETGETLEKEKRIEQLEKEIEEQFGTELRERFDEDLDSAGSIEVAGAEFDPSQVLFTMDSAWYKQALSDFQKQEIDDAIDTIIRLYPTPIAYHFYQATNKDNNVERRFAGLKDTWEAAIYLLFAIVLGEFRVRKHPLNISNNPSWKYLCDWKLSAKLDIIQRLYDFASQKNYNLSCQKILSPDLLTRIRKLNDVRNEYAHSSSWSKTQTQEQLERYLGEVVAILQLAQEMQNIQLLRYFEGTEVHNKPRFDIYVGRYLDHDRKVRDISGWNILDPSVLNDSNILVMHDAYVYTICPWYHFVLADEGHSTRLCYYKQQDSSSRDMAYEIIGQARALAFPEANFNKDLNEINNLLVAGASAT